MKRLVDLMLAAGIYVLFAGCIAFGLATLAVLVMRLWNGSCIA